MTADGPRGDRLARPRLGSESSGVIVIGPIRVLSVIAAPLACLAGASPPTVESENVGERGSVKGSPSGPSAASREAVSLYAGAGGDHHSLVMGVRRRVLATAKPAGVPRLFAQPAAAGAKGSSPTCSSDLDDRYATPKTRLTRRDSPSRPPFHRPYQSPRTTDPVTEATPGGRAVPQAVPDHLPTDSSPVCQRLQDEDAIAARGQFERRGECAHASPPHRSASVLPGNRTPGRSRGRVGGRSRSAGTGDRGARIGSWP